MKNAIIYKTLFEYKNNESSLSSRSTVLQTGEAIKIQNNLNKNIICNHLKRYQK
jgi:hypothetical protein